MTYRKVEPEIKPGKHIVSVVEGMTGYQIKELLSKVPDRTTLIGVHEDGTGNCIFTFEEDALELKLAMQGGGAGNV